MCAQHTLANILEQLQKALNQGLSTIKGVEATLYVNLKAQPAFFKAHMMPFALRQKIKAELDRLEKQEIIISVRFSEWAASIVPVAKRDGTVRICSDYTS